MTESPKISPASCQRFSSVLLTSVIRPPLSTVYARLPRHHVQHPGSTSIPLMHRRIVLAHPRAYFSERCGEENSICYAVTPVLRQGAVLGGGQEA